MSDEKPSETHPDDWEDSSRSGEDSSAQLTLPRLPAFEIESRIGPYRILGKLGHGAMGEVYKARDERLLRDVALKMLRSGLEDPRAHRSRLLREAQAAARVMHPNVLTVFEVGEFKGAIYIAMELIEGSTLRSHIKARPSVTQSLRLAKGIAMALAAAHSKGVVHRDLKPDNVIVQEGRARILDFGLAKFMERPTRGGALATTVTLKKPPQEITHDGWIVGTPAYMSPEQARGDSIDTRSDIFSFGALLYEMLTGKVAFQGATITEVLRAVSDLDPPPASRLSADVPTELDALLEECLSKQPEKRPDAHLLPGRLQQVVDVVNLRSLDAESLSSIRARVLRARNRADLVKEKYAIEQYLAAKGHDVEGSVLRDQVDAALSAGVRFSHLQATPPRLSEAETLAQHLAAASQELTAEKWMDGGTSQVLLERGPAGHLTLGIVFLALGRTREALDCVDSVETVDFNTSILFQALLRLHPAIRTSREGMQSLRVKLAQLDYHHIWAPLFREYLNGLLSARLGQDDVALAHAVALEEIGRRKSLQADDRFCQERRLATDLAHSIRAEVARVQHTQAWEFFEIRKTCREESWKGVLAGDLDFHQDYERFTRALLHKQHEQDSFTLSWLRSIRCDGLGMIYEAPAAHATGQILERHGHLKAAKESYERFVELWGDCEPGLRPAVERIHAKLRRLA